MCHHGKCVPHDSPAIAHCDLLASISGCTCLNCTMRLEGKTEMLAGERFDPYSQRKKSVISFYMCIDV